MKKLLCLLLAVLMCFGIFAGCSSKDNDSSDESKTTDSTSEDASTSDNDNSTEESDLQKIKDKGTMVIGITNYEPMNYLDENGEWTGFDTEFAQAVGEKIGVEVEFIEIDWDNKIFELDSGSIDCVWNGMTLTDEVESAMSCSVPYVKNAQVLVMSADKINDYTSIDSLSDLTFAVESGSAGESALTDNGIENYTAVLTQSDALLEVDSGSADACVIDITMAKAMTGDGTSYADLTYGLELTSEVYVIGFRTGSDMVEEVNGIIDELKADGYLDTLAEKYSLNLAD
jgi:polar amino acid transport system substrate-binding protein